MIQLYKHQSDALKETEAMNRVAYYHDMGLGKTFTGSEKMVQLGGKTNLVICQKSKIEDWKNHFRKHYKEYNVSDLTLHNRINAMNYTIDNNDFTIGIINYELAFRRPELLEMNFNTVMIDESSLIQNDTAKRTKFISHLNTENIILLSGTPTGGKYENLYSQLKLLGLPMNKKEYYDAFIKTRKIDMHGFKIQVVTGYKNVGRLKRLMRRLGCNFMKTEDVFDLPEQNFININIPVSRQYEEFRKNKIVEIPFQGLELIGDTTLTKMLYERQLCGMFSNEKYTAFCELLNETDDRLVVFYNFDGELLILKDCCEKAKRPVSEVNGHVKNLDAYEKYDNSVTLIQYQSGAMGLNLQKSNKIIYFSPPLSSELFEQSKKRTHRIGQEKPCFYYQMICKNSIEEKIYSTLAERRDFTEKLFEGVKNYD